MGMIGSSQFQNDVQEFIRRPLSSPLYLLVRFYLLFFHQMVSFIYFVILLLNLSLNNFGTQTNLLVKPLMLLLRLTIR
ncbi:hypothetical protein Gotur_036084 [Gossypium turneri]